MKEKARKVIDKFFKFFEMDAFDPSSEKHKAIVQRRINLMMDSPLMTKWLKECSWFNKDELLTNEVISYLINCATTFFSEKEFKEKINYNSKEWITDLDIRISKIKKLN
tara:strand:- start:717 stop:1043 length:327 start_codon:yes stop_codon:yes gene_type:complete